MNKNTMNKKISFVKLIAILIFTFSLTKLNFDNLSFQENVKSYIGFAVFIIFILYDLIKQKN